MGEYTIKAAFAIEAKPDDVSRWLATAEGVAGWWSDGTAGSASAVGDRFTVVFPDTPVPFELEVTERSAGSVEWFIAENPPWWKGTTIRFDLEGADGGGTALLFTHRGFDPGDPIIQAITPAWVRFLDNLVAVAESGRPNAAVKN